MASTRSTPVTLRVVLDTNLVLSALVFSAGAVAGLRRGWQRGRFTPLVSTATAGELIRVLAYPKFRLSSAGREDLLSDYLPFCEAIGVPTPPPPTPPCRDPFDVQFLEVAVAGEADYLVTGDNDLLALTSELRCPIVTAGEFLTRLGIE